MKKPGPQGLDALDGPPVLQIDDADLALLDVRGREHGPALVVPGDARGEVGHPVQVQVGDLTPQVHVDHLARAAVAGGPQDDAVGWAKGERVQTVGEVDATNQKVPALARDILVQRIVVHGAVVDRQRVVAVLDLPKLGDVLKGSNEAGPRRGIVDGADPRPLAGVVLDGDDPDRAEIYSGEQDQAVGQRVGDHDITAVGGNRQVAGVDPGADLGDGLEAVEAEAADAAIAGGEVDEAPIGRELGPPCSAKRVGNRWMGLSLSPSRMVAW